MAYSNINRSLFKLTIMSTKVSILSEMAGITPKETKKRNIEFVNPLIIFENAKNKVLVGSAILEPSEWENVILLAEKYGNTDKDLMFAYDKNLSDGCFYLGYFNDGIV